MSLIIYSKVARDSMLSLGSWVLSLTSSVLYLDR
jgi:hypothetical protein